jgi:hypothetical protein
MTAGHLFLVSYPREGDAPLRATYAIATDADEQGAHDLLTIAFVEPGLDIAYARALSSEEIKKLGLEAGQFRSIWPTREL